MSVDATDTRKDFAADTRLLGIAAAATGRTQGLIDGWRPLPE
jgi:hypothetical protein